MLDNTILGNAAQGVLLKNATLNTIDGNEIGGTTAGPGLEIDGTGNVSIENDIPSTGTPSETITLSEVTATRNTITNNYIGISRSGTGEGNQADGIFVNGASYNFIGQADAGNFIADNGASGVEITGTVTEITQDGTTVTDGRQLIVPPPGNGPDVPSGTAGNPSLAAEFSFMLAGAVTLPDPTIDVNSVGGATAGVPTCNWIAGNSIGTDTAGDPGLGNALDGILVLPAARLTLIGSGDTTQPTSSMPATGNVIGGNGKNGVEVDGNQLNAPIDDSQDVYGDHLGSQTYLQHSDSFGNYVPVFELLPTLISGNSIGINATNQVLSNGMDGGGDGVLLSHSRAVLTNNVLVASLQSSGTGGNGLEISGAAQFSLYMPDTDTNGYLQSDMPLEQVGSIAVGNRIGVGWDGQQTADDQANSLGNQADGVLLAGGTQGNLIGPLVVYSGQDSTTAGVAASEANVISNNDGWGVHVQGIGVFHAQGPDNNKPYFDPFLYPQGLALPYGTFGNRVDGNYIGTDAAGTTAASNLQGGLLVDNAAAFTVIGDFFLPFDQQWYGNVISGKCWTGSGSQRSRHGGHRAGGQLHRAGLRQRNASL